MAINPLQPPINYMGMAPQLDLAKQFEGFGQALAERQKRTQAEAIKAAYATDLETVLSNPSISEFNKFALKYPQQREVVKDVASRFTTEQQDAEFNIGRDVAVALENGKPEIALGVLNKTIEARKGSNLPTTVYDQIQQILSNTEDPDRVKKAQAQTNFSLTLLNPEKFAKVAESLQKQKLAPEEFGEQQAKTKQAITEAQTKVADLRIKLQNEPIEAERLVIKRDLETAQAAEAAITAKYAERKAIDDIIKRAADLNFTKAQTNKFLVETRNLTETGKMLKLDYEAAVKGVPLPSKNTGANVGNATEDERKAAGWLSQADNAYKNMLSAMYTKEGKRTGAEEPGVGEAIFGNIARGADRQNFVQAASSLSEALLRAATGAGVNADEAKQKLEELTPLLTDGAAVVGQKLAAIPVYLDSLKARAGRAAPTDYRIPTKESVTAAKEITITVGGKTFSFPTQDAADAFKKAAGIN